MHSNDNLNISLFDLTSPNKILISNVTVHFRHQRNRGERVHADRPRPRDLVVGDDVGLPDVSPQPETAPTRAPDAAVARALPHLRVNRRTFCNELVNGFG